jgi:predicted transcriptional regulator
MTQRQLTISLQPDWRTALAHAGQQAAHGLKTKRYQGETLNFESPGVFFGQLTERRWALVHALQSAGAISLREAARRVGRDVRRVHEDVHILLNLGLLEKDESGSLVCPFKRIHIDMQLEANNNMALAA